MIYRLLRFTPTRSLTYNNRWYTPVYPKHSIFFIEPDLEQFFLWLDFLCTTHKRNFLYIHTVTLSASRISIRNLTTWKGKKLREVVIRTRDYGKRKSFRTQRVMKYLKSKPKILKLFGI